MLEWLKGRLAEQRTKEGVIFFLVWAACQLVFKAGLDASVTAALSCAQAYKMVTPDAGATQ